MAPFIPSCDVEPSAQWCSALSWDKCWDGTSSAWSTCADSAECEVASVPGTPSVASLLRRRDAIQSQSNPKASSSNGSTPRSAQGDVSLAEPTASQQHLMQLRASGQATLKVLATGSTPSALCHTDQPVDNCWSGLAQWCNDNDVACHMDVPEKHIGWRSCGEIRQDALTVLPGLHASLQWD